MADDQIPYEDVDCEIRPLVTLLNRLPGIRTISSCAGHSAPSEEAGVAFVAETQESVTKLLVAISEVSGWRGGFISNRAEWKAAWVAIMGLTDGKIIYSLRIDGYPKHAERELIQEIES